MTLGAGLTSILRNGGNLFSGVFAEFAFRGLYMLAIGRILGPDTYGVWTYALTTYGLVLAVSALGMPIILPIELGRSRDRAEYFLRNAFTLRLIVLSLGSLAYLGYALLVEPDSDTRKALVLVAPALIARDISIWAGLVFIGVERTGYATRWGIALRGAEVIFGTSLLLAGTNIFVLLGIHGAIWTVTAVVLMRRVSQIVFHPRLSWNFNEMSKVFRRGLPFGLRAIMENWMLAGPLILLRHKSADVNALGQFGLALQLTLIAVACISAFLQPAFPVLARSRERRDHRVAMYGGLISIALILGFGSLSILAFWAGPTIVTTVFGSGFEQAGDLLWIVLLASGAGLYALGYEQVLATDNRPWASVVAHFGAAFFFTLLFAPCYERFGLAGTAIALAIAQCLKSFSMIVWYLLVKPDDTSTKTIE